MSGPWAVLHGRRFYRELAQVPAGVRQRAEELAFGGAIRQDPFLGGRAERLRGIRSVTGSALGSIVSGC